MDFSKELPPFFYLLYIKFPLQGVIVLAESLFKKYGIAQVTIPLPFRLNHIHCYLSRQGEKDWTIIDTGLNRAESREKWRESFSHYGIIGDDIKKILLTHYHPDHLGYAGQLQDETGAGVQMGKEAYEQGIVNWTEENQKKVHKFYMQSGMEEKLVKDLIEHDRVFFSLVRPFPSVSSFIEEGNLIAIGELEFKAVHTPGHEEGHFCFYNSEEKILISGDHLLKKITPNISYLGSGDDNPLAVYLTSLEKISRLEIEFVLPGHGPIFHDAKERIFEIIRHHEERIEETFDTLAGEMSAFQVSRKLFRGGLTVHEERFAVGEAVAHLHYLLEKGEVKKTPDGNGVWYFSRC